VGAPPLRRRLTGTHTGLGRLLRERPFRVDVDPHLPTTADVAGHGDTSRLDLAVGHVRVLKRLNAVLAEHDPGAALGGSAASGPVLLAGLGPARGQPGQLPSAPGGAAASVLGARSPRPPRRAPPERRGRSPPLRSSRSRRWPARAPAAAASRSARLVDASPL